MTVLAAERGSESNARRLLLGVGVGILLACTGCAGGASAEGPFDMAVRISTAKHPDNPPGVCSYQVTGLRFAQLFNEKFEVQDGHGNVLGKGPIGVPHVEGDMCSFDTIVPGIPAMTAYQIVVKLHGPAPGAPVTEAREPFTAEEARSGQVRMVVTGPASG